MSNSALKLLGHRKIRFEILVSSQIFSKSRKLYEEIKCASYVSLHIPLEHFGTPP